MKKTSFRKLCSLEFTQPPDGTGSDESKCSQKLGNDYNIFVYYKGKQMNLLNKY